MTVSREHDQLVDCIRFSVPEYLRSTGKDCYEVAIVFADTMLFNAFTGWGLTQYADCYIIPWDGGGPIMVEVGHMPKKKWSGEIYADGKPVRVMRCTFDGAVGLTFPRGTDFEKDFMPFVSQRVATLIEKVSSIDTSIDT